MNEEIKRGEATVDLLEKAKSDLAQNMDDRGIGAILWDNASAGFHFIPEIELPAEGDKEPETRRLMGIYNYNGVLYLIEEDESGVKIDDFYDPDSEVRPTIVTLTPDVARQDFGNPTGKRGFTTDGDLEEWLAIADCYFEAISEQFEE